jgi:3-methyladenine DNA glycosylase AlkD
MLKRRFRNSQRLATRRCVRRTPREAPVTTSSVSGSVTSVRVADWLNSYVVKKHPDKETFRKVWMTSDDPMAARAGWTLTAERVAKSPAGLGLPALLDRIESEMPNAAPVVQWTMNTCLAEIGIHFADQRERAIAIGETLGIYRDYPVSKGCTSPFAPIWINAMVSRQG